MPVDDLKVRVPRDVKEWLKTRAEANCRTMNGEILALLKTIRKAETDKKGVVS
ncbi:Arc family DNA-binding protein [Mesorhizobium sp. SB112]